MKPLRLLAVLLLLAIMLAQPPHSARALKFTAGLDGIYVEGLPGSVFTRAFHLTLDKAEQRLCFVWSSES